MLSDNKNTIIKQNKNKITTLEDDYPEHHDSHYYAKRSYGMELL